jgi:chromosome segregation ATPase
LERQTQSQLVELLMQPLLCHTLHSWVLSPAAREREEALALGRQHLAQNQEAFDVAELAHMRRCAHRERTQGALEQCQTTAALRQQYQSKVSRILFTEARVAELRQEAAVRGPQRHKERQHEADQVANNVSTQVAPIERQQHRLEADIKKAQQKRRDLRQRQASKAQAVDEDETCMQEGRLEVGHLDERIDEEQQMLKRAKRRQQAAQAEIVRRIPNHD